MYLSNVWLVYREYKCITRGTSHEVTSFSSFLCFVVCDGVGGEWVSEYKCLQGGHHRVSNDYIDGGKFSWRGVTRHDGFVARGEFSVVKIPLYLTVASYMRELVRSVLSSPLS